MIFFADGKYRAIANCEDVEDEANTESWFTGRNSRIMCSTLVEMNRFGINGNRIDDVALDDGDDGLVSVVVVGLGDLVVGNLIFLDIFGVDKRLSVKDQCRVDTHQMGVGLDSCVIYYFLGIT